LAELNRRNVDHCVYGAGPVYRSPPVAAVRTAVPTRVQRPASQVARYQVAVADKTREPEATRFREVFVVKHPLGETDALCGEINAKNAYGGYVGYQLFYAPIVPVGNGFSAVLWTAESTGNSTVSDKCGISGNATPAS
jgi:hypothetical protein